MVHKIWAAVALCFVTAFSMGGCGTARLQGNGSGQGKPTEPDAPPASSMQPVEKRGAEAYAEIKGFFSFCRDLSKSSALPGYESAFSLCAESTVPGGAGWDAESGARVELSRSDHWSETGTAVAAFSDGEIFYVRQADRSMRYCVYQTLQTDRVEEIGERTDKTKFRYGKDPLAGDYAIFTRETDAIFTVGAKDVAAGVRDESNDAALCALVGLDGQAGALSLLRLLNRRDFFDSESYYSKRDKSELFFSFDVVSNPPNLSDVLIDRLVGESDEDQNMLFEAKSGGEITCSIKLNSDAVPVEIDFRMKEIWVEIMLDTERVFYATFSAERSSRAVSVKISPITLEDMRAIYPELDNLNKTPSLAALTAT